MAGASLSEDEDDICDVSLIRSDSDDSINPADLDSLSSSDESVIIGARSRQRHGQISRPFGCDLPDVNDASNGGIRDSSQPGPAVVLVPDAEAHAAVAGAGEVSEHGVVRRAGLKRKFPYDQGNHARARLRGQSFVSTKSKVHHARMMRPNPCTAVKQRCANITDQVRLAAFERFYSAVSITEQRSMLSSSIAIVPKRTGKSKRVRVSYSVANENGERLPVCREFLMATLDITAEQVRTVIKSARSGQPQTKRSGRSDALRVNPQRLDAARVWI